MMLQGSDTLKHSRVADLKPREARPPDGFAVRASRLGEALAMRKRRLPKPERRDTDGYACGAQWVRYAALNRSKVAHDSSFMCSDKRGRDVAIRSASAIPASHQRAAGGVRALVCVHLPTGPGPRGFQ